MQRTLRHLTLHQRAVVLNAAAIAGRWAPPGFDAATALEQITIDTAGTSEDWSPPGTDTTPQRFDANRLNNPESVTDMAEHAAAAVLVAVEATIRGRTDIVAALENSAALNRIAWADRHGAPRTDRVERAHASSATMTRLKALDRDAKQADSETSERLFHGIDQIAAQLHDTFTPHSEREAETARTAALEQAAKAEREAARLEAEAARALAQAEESAEATAELERLRTLAASRHDTATKAQAARAAANQARSTAEQLKAQHAA